MTYWGGDVVWAMYHHHGCCCSINLLAIHFRSGVWAFGTYAVPVLICTLSMRGCVGSICDELFLWLRGKQKYPWHIVYIYIHMLLLCLCNSVGVLLLCCWYVAVALLLCCCYGAVMHLVCRFVLLLCCCCTDAMLLCCCCFSLKVFSFVVLQWPFMESILLKLFIVGTYFVKVRFCWSVYAWNLFRLYGMLALTYSGARFSGKLVYIWNLFLENGI